MSSIEVDLPSRHVPFQGTPNFRDYGGYSTSDGRQVKWRKLFRSGQLASLTEDDRQQFAELEINLVFDFRQDMEREKDPSLFPVTAKPLVVDLPITPGSSASFFDQVAAGDISTEEMVAFMCDVNRDFALEKSNHYREMFTHILNQEDGASLVHCSAGKDRTGFAAAMMLTALGVPQETIFEDYMLTGSYFHIDDEIERISNKYQWGSSVEAIRPMLEVRESYLLAAFEAIEQHYVRVEDYLSEALGLGAAECELLQARFLTEDAC